MPFPDSARTIYRDNPLEQVICQLRFPAILRIDAELPVNFQEGVRGTYPVFREKQAFQFGDEVPVELAKALSADGALRLGRACDFLSSDESWTLSLTRDFIALTAKKYQRWEEFLDRLRRPVEVLHAVYQPAYFSRIGLRYQNVIRRSRLGLNDVSWPELLKPVIAAELASPEIAGGIDHVAHELLVTAREGAYRVLVKHGLGLVDDEKCYFIDADFFSDQKTEIRNAFSILDGFNRQAGNLFRWCIADRLHDAMGPQPVV